MKKSITLSSVAIASLLLVGCGSGGGAKSTSIGTGYYIDSAVAGVDYICGTQTGTTDINGKFIFEENKNCTFKVGNIILREVNASTLKDGITILEDNPDTARFLQTLDIDGNASNGIEVSDAVKKLNIKEIPKDDAVLASVRDDIKANDDKYQGRVVTTQEAQEHLIETRIKIRDNNRETQYTNNSVKEQTRAYFGDKANNLIVVVDVENMKVLDKVATGNSVSYAAEVIKTRDSHGSSTPKMYVDNRGSNAIGVLDSATNTITKNIELEFHPRSIDVQKQTGLVSVSGVDKPMVAIIDSKTDRVIATVGNNEVTAPTNSGHSYLASGTMASGHPHWLNENHFVLIDRQNKSISTYKIEKNSDGSWNTTKVNEISTPSPVHNLIPPEIHGQHGKKHGMQTSTVFYATAEGSEGVYPSVLKLEFLEGEGLSIAENLEIKKEGLSPDVMGVHHLNFLKDQKTIYVGSDEGNLFIVDYTTSPMTIVKTVKAGMGAGHTDEMKHNKIAVIINHKDSFITLMNTQTHEKIADIEVSKLAKDELGSVQTQSHPKYHFSKDGSYFYMFLTEEGAFVKVDLTAKKVVDYLAIGGKLAMGSFVEIKDKEGHASSREDSRMNDDSNNINNQNEQNSNTNRDNDHMVGNRTNTSPVIGKGYYVDSAIEGVEYICGTQTGTTDVDGKFIFEENKNCTFKVGNIILREVNASTLKDGITILEDNPDTARFLQTLDRDGDASNGIEVSDAVKKLDITEVPKDDAVLASVRDDIKANDDKYQGRVVTLQEAQEHLRETRNGLENNNSRDSRMNDDSNRNQADQSSEQNRDSRMNDDSNRNQADQSSEQNRDSRMNDDSNRNQADQNSEQNRDSRMNDDSNRNQADQSSEQNRDSRMNNDSNRNQADQSSDQNRDSRMNDDSNRNQADQSSDQNRDSHMNDDSSQSQDERNLSNPRSNRR